MRCDAAPPAKPHSRATPCVRASPITAAGTTLAGVGSPGRDGAPLVHSSPFAPFPHRASFTKRRSAFGTDADRRRRERDDPAEQRCVLVAGLDAQQGIRIALERGIDLLPVRRRKELFRERQYFPLLGLHVIPVKLRVRLHGDTEVGKLRFAPGMKARERLLERADLVVAGAMLGLEAVEQRCRFGGALPQDAEQVAILLGMVKALRKGIDVIDHRLQHAEVWLGRALADFANEIEHAVHDGCQRAMFVANDAYGLHRPSTCGASAVLLSDRSLPPGLAVDLDQSVRRSERACTRIATPRPRSHADGARRPR